MLFKIKLLSEDVISPKVHNFTPQDGTVYFCFRQQTRWWPHAVDTFPAASPRMPSSRFGEMIVGYIYVPLKN